MPGVPAAIRRAVHRRDPRRRLRSGHEVQRGGLARHPLADGQDARRQAPRHRPRYALGHRCAGGNLLFPTTWRMPACWRCGSTTARPRSTSGRARPSPSATWRGSSARWWASRASSAGTFRGPTAPPSSSSTPRRCGRWAGVRNGLARRHRAALRITPGNYSCWIVFTAPCTAPAASKKRSRGSIRPTRSRPPSIFRSGRSSYRSPSAKPCVRRT